MEVRQQSKTESIDRTDVPDSRIPGYEMIECLGKGGMGVVCLARQLDTGRMVAVKFIGDNNQNPFEEGFKRFERERRLLAEISHPNIIQYLDSGVVEGRPYLVLEYATGGNLRQIMKPGQLVDTQTALGLLSQVADALSAMHERGILHRDLKPENILLDETKTPKLADFGLSAELKDVGALTTTGQVVCTLDYAAPEQRTRLPVNARTDQYSWALIAYEMLTGKRALGRIKKPSELNPRLNEEVDRVLFRALQDDPDDRFESITELNNALQSAAKKRSKLFHRRLRIAHSSALLLAVTCGLYFGWPYLYPRSAKNPQPPGAPGNASTALSKEEKIKRIAYLVGLAEKHSKEHERELALKCLSQAIQLDATNAALFVKRAHSYMLNGEYPKALADLDAALKLDEALPEAYLKRGEIYLQLQDLPKALADLNKSIDLDASSSLAFANRGRIHRLKRRYDEAIEDFDKAIKLDADNGLAYFYRGQIHQVMKKYAKALPDYKEAVRCTPDNPFAHGALSLLLSSCPDKSLRNPSLAVTHATRACELSRWKESLLLRRLAQALLASGDVDGAISYCEAALKVPASSMERRRVNELLEKCRQQANANPGVSQP